MVVKDTRDQAILDVKVSPTAIVTCDHQWLRADLMLSLGLFVIL